MGLNRDIVEFSLQGAFSWILKHLLSTGKGLNKVNIRHGDMD
jgi:hypothetical protein